MGPSTRWTPDLYNGVRHHPQLNWGLSSNNLQQEHKSIQQMVQVSQRENLDTNPSSEWGGNSNLFGELVDLGLLLRFSNFESVWVVVEGDRGEGSLQQWWGERIWSLGWLVEEEGVFIPLPEVDRFLPVENRNFRFRTWPEIPVNRKFRHKLPVWSRDWRLRVLRQNPAKFSPNRIFRFRTQPENPVLSEIPVGISGRVQGFQARVLSHFSATFPQSEFPVQDWTGYSDCLQGAFWWL